MLVAVELHSEALQRGSVRILVETEAPYGPEAQLPTPAPVVAQHLLPVGPERVEPADYASVSGHIGCDAPSPRLTVVLDSVATTTATAVI
jgi:hypothetical protein